MMTNITSFGHFVLPIRRGPNATNYSGRMIVVHKIEERLTPERGALLSHCKFVDEWFKRESCSGFDAINLIFIGNLIQMGWTAGHIATFTPQCSNLPALKRT